MFKTEINSFSDHERFLKFIKIDPQTSCWEWQGSLNEKGYGCFRLNNTTKKAHRVSFSIFNGSVDSSLEIDHQCKNRKCVNPEHLHQTTRMGNILNSENITSKFRDRTHCSNGHEYTEENTRYDKTRFKTDSLSRVCRACQRIRLAKFKGKKC